MIAYKNDANKHLRMNILTNLVVLISGVSSGLLLAAGIRLWVLDNPGGTAITVLFAVVLMALNQILTIGTQITMYAHGYLFSKTVNYDRTKSTISR